MVTPASAFGVTALTLAAMTALGLWYSRGRIGSVEDLITARNSAGTGFTAATIIATSTGAWVLFTPSEAAAVFGGLSAILGYAVGSVVASLVYIPVGSRIRTLIPRGHSLTEYVYVRFGRAMYVYVLAVTIAYLFLVLASGMTGITSALSIIGGVPAWATAVLVGTFVLVYTAYGGLIASIFTDAVQTLLIFPLLVASVVAAVIGLGGVGEIHATVAAADPQLLDPFYAPGLEFGLYASIGIIAVSLFHQGYWQRVFAAREDRVVRRSFGVAALASIPVIVLPGVLGLAAVGLGLVEGPTDGSIGMFLVIQETLPEWVALAVVVLAVLLVMSTADTLFNAIASIVTADLQLVVGDVDDGTLKLVARSLTVAVGVGAIVVGIQGYSVLQLLLLANLLATATVLPFVAGLYSRRITQVDAILASVVALVAGVALFPLTNPILASILDGIGTLPEPSYLAAYSAAALLSGGLTVVLTLATPGNFELGALGSEIRSLDAATDGGEAVDGGEDT